MEKLQCELCNSIDIVKLDDGFYQCQYCGCKYTPEQAKAMLGGTVETTMGDAELKRRVDNAKAQMEIGQPANDTINSIIKDFPGSRWGYWLSIENSFKRMLEGISFTSYYQLKSYHESLLKIAQHSSEITEQEVTDLWDNGFAKVYNAMIDGEISLVGYQSKEDLLTLHPLMKKAYDMGIANANTLKENRLALYGNGSSLTWILSNSATVRGYDKYPIVFALGKTLSYADFNGGGTTIRTRTESVPMILTNTYLNTLRTQAAANSSYLATTTKKCPNCCNELSRFFLSSTFECKTCHLTYPVSKRK